MRVCVVRVHDMMQGSKKGGKGKGKEGAGDEKKVEMIKRLAGGYTKRLEK